MQFVEVTKENIAHVEKIFAGEKAQYWVHYNTYWLENSRKHSSILARLIEVDAVNKPIGFIAYGPHYTDEALSQIKPKTYEIIHLVIDEAYQGCGYGRRATMKAIEELQKNDDCQSIVIAHHPDNMAAKKLYTDIGFTEIGKNYNDDPLLMLRLGE